jgi:hypothetical protein
LRRDRGRMPRLAPPLFAKEQQKVPRVWAAGLRLALALAVTRTTTGAVRTLDLLAKGSATRGPVTDRPGYSSPCRRRHQMRATVSPEWRRRIYADDFLGFEFGPHLCWYGHRHGLSVGESELWMFRAWDDGGDQGWATENCRATARASTSWRWQMASIWLRLAFSRTAIPRPAVRSCTVRQPRPGHPSTRTTGTTRRVRTGRAASRDRDDVGISLLEGADGWLEDVVPESPGADHALIA